MFSTQLHGVAGGPFRYQIRILASWIFPCKFAEPLHFTIAVSTRVRRFHMAVENYSSFLNLFHNV